MSAEVPNIAFYTFLRAPIARCISQYQYDVALGRVPDDSFNEWIQREDVQDLQVKSLVGSADTEGAIKVAAHDLDFIGLTEAFEESLAMMPSLIDSPVIRPQRKKVNAANSNQIREQLLADPDALARIRAANIGDLELYDYVERHIYPRERQRASRTTLGCRPRHASINGRFIANAGFRYGVYKPAVAAWRTGFRWPSKRNRVPAHTP
ncbi:hypothetical protein [Salinisphaera orenii]|uniref:hypothetical protein n=1 Tax=Salinisphaera orenii TaxID=856731 RepID=UPI003A4C5685